MLRKLKITLLAASVLAILASCTPAYAGVFICSGLKQGSLLRSEVIQLYIGNRVTSEGRMVNVLILPLSDASTNEAFGVLGISKLSLEKRMQTNALIDSGVRVYRTTDELMFAMPKNRPSIAFSPYITSTYEINPCF